MQTFPFSRFVTVAATFGLCSICFSFAADKTIHINVSAGDSDRREVPVFFKAPADVSGAAQIRDKEGHVAPVQIEANQQASFILQELPRNSTRSFELIHASTTEAKLPEVQTTRAGSKLKVTQNGKTVLEYQAEPSVLPRPEIKPNLQRGGYIHPIVSPSGLEITDDYPRNHLHHHGIWFPWTKTEFEGRDPDFWNMGLGKGRVEFVSLLNSWSGPVHGGFSARHRFVDLTSPEPKTALNETWEVRIYKTGQNQKPTWTFDLVSTQECASTSPLILPEYLYGGLGFRGNGQWDGKEKTFFLTSEGETSREKGNLTRARWCYVGGVVNGQQTGIAILGHPENFRAPQPMRLHPSEPFFCFAPSQLGKWEITPGKPYSSKYRFIVFDGLPDRAEIDRLWNDYAHPPEVKVE